MVIVHVKRDHQSLFLIETKLEQSVSDLIDEICKFENGRQKILRINRHLEQLKEYGVEMKAERKGMNKEQVV